MNRVAPPPGIAVRLARACLALAAFGWVAAWAPDAAAQGALAREYRIKAAYLFKFIEYIQWSPEARLSADPVITLCLLGQSPFGTALAPLRGKVVKDRTLEIELVAHLEEIDACQVLFISPSESERLPLIVDRLRDAPVLSVSEMEGSAERGVVINFVAERNRVRFEINREAARRHGLTISSQLLKLAKLVEP